MRITAIRDIVAPIASDIANAYIDFSAMTASVVAIETDVVVDGKPVVDSASTPTAATRRPVCCVSVSFRASLRPSLMGSSMKAD